MDARIVPEWPGFDEDQHSYVVQTGGGDGWYADDHQDEGQSLDDVLREDMLTADFGDEPEPESWEDYIDDLFVVGHGERGEWQEIARFDVSAFEWRDRSQCPSLDWRES